MDAKEDGLVKPIVIGELLCFISNKASSIKKASSIVYQLLIKLCLDTFTDLKMLYLM